MDQQERQDSPDVSIGVSQFREMLYLFFSRAFSAEADIAFLQNIPHILEAIENLSDLVEAFETSDLKKGKDLLTTFFKNMYKEKDKENSALEELARDYAALFLGVGQNIVSLCESVYQSKNQTTFGKPYFEVKKKYEETGFSKSEDFPEPDDHLAVELAHMANLCRMSINSVEDKTESYRYLGLQKEFMDTHLSRWVPGLTEALLEISHSVFFNGMALMLNGYIHVDANLIDALIEQTSSMYQEKERR